MKEEKNIKKFLNLKIERVRKEDILYLDALPVETVEVENWEEGHMEIRKFLREIGIEDVESIMQFLKNTYVMRGAMLLDVDRLKRLERDKSRGIRATNMDMNRTKGQNISNEKKAEVVRTIIENVEVSAEADTHVQNMSAAAQRDGGTSAASVEIVNAGSEVAGAGAAADVSVDGVEVQE